MTAKPDFRYPSAPGCCALPSSRIAALSGGSLASATDAAPNRIGKARERFREVQRPCFSRLGRRRPEGWMAIHPVREIGPRLEWKCRKRQFAARILETPDMWSASQVFGRLSPFGFQGFYGARRGRRGRAGSGTFHEVEGRYWSEARLAGIAKRTRKALEASLGKTVPVKPRGRKAPRQAPRKRPQRRAPGAIQAKPAAPAPAATSDPKSRAAATRRAAVEFQIPSGARAFGPPPSTP
jgi:hypothetical protein